MTTNVPLPQFAPAGLVTYSEQDILAGVQADYVSDFALSGKTLSTELTTPQEQPSDERLTTSERRMLHDFPHLMDFYQKHALGPMRAPSCLRCGKSMQGEVPALKHLELPGIVICADCMAPHAAPQGDIQAMLKDPIIVHRNMCHGTIAPITFDQLAHVLGDDAKREWLAKQAAPQEQPSDAKQMVLDWMGENDVVLKDRAFKQLCALLSRYGAAPQEQPSEAFKDLVVTLLNHIEDVVSDEDWERVDVELWNRVSRESSTTAPQAGETK